MGYIEKRALLELEHSRNLAKLAQQIKPALKEEVRVESVFYLEKIYSMLHLDL